jgi:hypothetical protein
MEEIVQDVIAELARRYELTYAITVSDFLDRTLTGDEKIAAEIVDSLK